MREALRLRKRNPRKKDMWESLKECQRQSVWLSLLIFQIGYLGIGVTSNLTYLYFLAFVPSEPSILMLHPPQATCPLS